MPQLAVTVVGPDQPGIVAALARVLWDRGGNLEDSAMTILGGHFAIVLLARSDEDPEVLRDALLVAAEPFGSSVSVSPVDEDRPTPEPTHLLSVYGTDRPGIVAEVASCLDGAGANITDLETTVVGEDEEPVYAMAIELAVDDDASLRKQLGQVCRDLGVSHTMRTIDGETYDG